MKVRCPYKCDYCLNPKGETNHWWLRPCDVNQFMLLAWNDLLADQDGHEHICSESCAAKALSRWMTQRSLEIYNAWHYGSAGDGVLEVAKLIRKAPASMTVS